MPAPKLKHVKTLVQHVFVLDHGDHLGEVLDPVASISAEDWPTYSGERFPREMAETQAGLDAQYAAENPNRAQRRASARTKPKPE